MTYCIVGFFEVLKFCELIKISSLVPTEQKITSKWIGPKMSMNCGSIVLYKAIQAHV